MSSSKNDQVFPNHNCLKSDAEFAALIASTLRSEYGGLYSSVKELARDMRVHPRTARNWYEGKNLIKSRHLVILARQSAAVGTLLTELLTGTGETQGRRQSTAGMDRSQPAFRRAPDRTQNVPINVPIKFLTPGLNARQHWFFNEILNKVAVGAADLVQVWNVAPKTAKRDIADLLQRGTITRIGSRKSGRYVAVLPDAESTGYVGHNVLVEDDPCS